jgi:hypothetical protein
MKSPIQPSSLFDTPLRRAGALRADMLTGEACQDPPQRAYRSEVHLEEIFEE